VRRRQFLCKVREGKHVWLDGVKRPARSATTSRASNNNMDLYKILGFARVASIPKIKASYRKLALTLHPDVTGGDKTKSDKLRQVQLPTPSSERRNEKEKTKYDLCLSVSKVTSAKNRTLFLVKCGWLSNFLWCCGV